MEKRFIGLGDVVKTLGISDAQAYALARSGDLPAIKVGGRGQSRIEATQLEAYVERMYSETAAFMKANTLGRGEVPDVD